MGGGRRHRTRGRQVLGSGDRPLADAANEVTRAVQTFIISAEEVFAPVVSVMPFQSLDEAIDDVNSTPFGLAAGLFTKDVSKAMTASRRLHVGIVHINEPSSSRVDLMPFAGVKDSGLGREGPKYAMQEMTEERLITISLE